MATKVGHGLQFSPWIDSGNTARKSTGSLEFSLIFREQQRLPILVSSHLRPRKSATWHRPLEFSRLRKIPVSLLETGGSPASFDEATVLKTKSEEVEPYLNGQCIYLVGMMGSGKTTVGRILSEALGYSFFDSDKLVEQAAGGTSVAEIFKLYGESFFRNNETEVLRKLASMHRLVVSTGGGAVIRPINWKYMHKGISVWLDVPLEALARRIAAVGTESRPLLHNETGDAYEKAFKRLSTLLEDRGEAYTNANAKVSLEKIAAKHGIEDVCNLTPEVIAIEALVQIESFLKKR